MADAELRNTGKHSRSEAFVILCECTLRRLVLSDCFIVAGARVWVPHGAVTRKYQKWSLADALIVFLTCSQPQTYARQPRCTRPRYPAATIRDDVPHWKRPTVGGNWGEEEGARSGKAMAYLAIISWVDCFVAYVLRECSVRSVMTFFFSDRRYQTSTLTTNEHTSTRLLNWSAARTRKHAVNLSLQVSDSVTAPSL
jgi:hypothetical protein